MKKYLLTLLVFLPILAMAQIPDTTDIGQVDDPNTTAATTSTLNSKLSALFSYNFSGNKRALSNLTPVVNYGWIKDWTKENGFTYSLGINPYVGGQINTRDSSSYVPALMLPGIAGLKIDGYITFQKNKDGFKFILSPVNFGYKLVSNFADTSAIIAQHNVRSSLAIAYGPLFMLSAQYTYGWHNSISESEKTFGTLMGKAATDIQYLNITLQTKIADFVAKSPTYLFIEWRGLLNGKSYQTFENQKIISIGFRSDFGFQNSNPGATGGL